VESWYCGDGLPRESERGTSQRAIGVRDFSVTFQLGMAVLQVTVSNDLQHWWNFKPVLTGWRICREQAHKPAGRYLRNLPGPGGCTTRVILALTPRFE